MKGPKAFPLSWPTHIARAQRREAGQFRTDLAGALGNVRKSLEAFGRESGKPVSGIVLSSNVTLGHDKPTDPGVAVWFTWEDAQICIPVDRYATPAANLQAIHHVLEARRTELRHGTLALVRATFQGFRALPAPKAPHEILGVAVNASADQVQTAWRKAIASAHPDQGGSEARAAELNAARDAMLGNRS